jgi:hypothetical protein
MVFNVGMDTKPNSLEADRRRIEDLGGPAKVARLLGYDEAGGVQRVCNWKARGIPPAVKLSRPDLFLGELPSSMQASAPELIAEPVATGGGEG